MKKLSAAIILLFALAAPAFAQGKAGQLDRTFGEAGRVTAVLGVTPAEPERPGTWLAWAGRGMIVAAAADSVLEYRSDGHLNRDFGAGGRVRLNAPEGMALELAGMSVDSRGRIVVAGTVTPEESAPEKAPASVFVARFLADGRPDLGFGDHGVLVTNLGLPVPPAPPNRALRPVPTVTEPVVRATGLAIDDLDRPLLSGTWVSGYRDCYPFIEETQVTSGFAVRLEAAGAIDPSFAGGVISPNPSREIEFAPITDGTESLFLAKDARCGRGRASEMELSWVREDGSLRPSFGAGGRVVLPNANNEAALAKDHFGRIFVLGANDELDLDHRRLLRLKRDGAVDRRFGAGGSVALPISAYMDHWALAVDPRGRALLAHRAADDEQRMVLIRRRRDGTIDHRFGSGGTAATRFPGLIGPQQILVGGGGKILVAGTFDAGNRFGIGLTRFLGR
jgi:uncharacterized delta-60 repeat protein